ncbi:MFS transporter [Corynebacterium sp. HMSC071B10]|uniref:MFS transporter n=1 Tax=Corynebacterium sp. HMSC071B10 TaxID=1739494 RepID=UPI0008D7AE8E|nr:MFS transporter [Corynebacterium sp. HMSC071B10]OFP36795.1 multidrug MFS transporter [Corynebacterium sp. HMSC071B10]
MKPAVNPWNTLAALAAGYFLVLIDQGFMPVITPLLPFDVGSAVWLTSIYLLCTVAPMPATGKLGDAFGQRGVFLIGLAIYVAALVLAGVSWSFESLMVARGLQGVGAAAFLPQAFGLIPRVFSPDTQGRAFAAWGVIGSVASLIGPVVGGAVADSLGWRAAFFAQAALGAVALIAGLIALPRLPRSGERVTLLPVLLSFGGLGLLVYGIQFGQWPSILFGALLLGVLVRSARDGTDNGFLPVGLILHRSFALGALGVAAMGFSVASMFIPLMYWLQTVAGASPTASGAITAPMSVFALVLTPVAGYLTDRRNPGKLCAAGFSISAAGLALAIALIHTGAGVWWFTAVTSLLGIGGAFVWAPNAAVTMRGIPEHETGAASGLYNTMRQVGSVLGVALVGAVLVRGDIAQTAHVAVLLPLAAMVIGAASSLALRRDDA